MLALTVLTAVQRFVKVWRQASQRAPGGHHHPAGARAGGRRARPRPPRRPGARTSRPVVGARSRGGASISSPPPIAGRGGLLPRRAPAGGRPHRQGAEPGRGHGRRPSAACSWPGTCAGSGPSSRAGPSTAPSTPPSTATPATGSTRSACPGCPSPRSTPASPSRASTTSRRPLAAGRGTILALPHLGGWEWAGVLAHPGHGRADHRRRRAGRAAGALRVLRRLPPPARHEHRARSGRRPPARCCGRSRTTTWSACSRPRHHRRRRRGRVLRRDAPRCPPGPATLALRTGAPLLPVGCYFDGATATTPWSQPPLDRRARGPPPRRRHPRHPGPGRRARGADPRRARAVAPPAAQLAERLRRPRRHRQAPSPACGAGRRRSPRRPIRCAEACASASSAPTASPCPAACRARCSALARALRALGHEVRVLGPCDGPPPDSGVTPLGDSIPTAANGSMAPIAPDPSAQLRTIRALRDERFDVVHLHEPLAPGVTQTALLFKPQPAGRHLPRRRRDRRLPVAQPARAVGGRPSSTCAARCPTDARADGPALRRRRPTSSCSTASSSSPSPRPSPAPTRRARPSSSSDATSPARAWPCCSRRWGSCRPACASGWAATVPRPRRCGPASPATCASSGSAASSDAEKMARLQGRRRVLRPVAAGRVVRGGADRGDGRRPPPSSPATSRATPTWPGPGATRSSCPPGDPGALAAALRAVLDRPGPRRRPGGLGSASGPPSSR